MDDRQLLLRGVRLVDLDRADLDRVDLDQAGSHPPPQEPVDVLVVGGAVDQVGRDLAAPPGVETVDAGGAFAIPGLWDQHVHMGQWALGRVRIDTSDATCPGDVLALVRQRVDELGADQASLVQGYGHRSAEWSHRGEAADLDVIAGDRPVVLISGDAHHGWLSSAALRELGLPSGPGSGIVEEAEWFAAYARLDEVFGPAPHLEDAVASVVHEAGARGVVGIVDFEFGGALEAWPARFSAGLDTLRVRASTYETGLDSAIARGLRTGDPLDLAGLLTMGPLKLISDGSLNTRTAWCCDPYCDSATRGVQNYTGEELVDLLTRASDAGIEAAVHAIGDAAVGVALDAFAATRARGSIEHAQLVTRPDVERLARLGVRASVQPAHLLDDRDVTEACWPDRSGRTFALRTMLDAGVSLAMGSDAPVAPLDPWLAIAAAVHRSSDEREAYHPEQAITVREALAASVDGQRLRPGARGDVVLVEIDPTAVAGDSSAVSEALRAVRPLLTVVAGRVVHQA